MRFRIVGVRWVDVTITVIVGFAVGFFFYWLQSLGGREEIEPAFALRLTADRLAVHLLEDDTPPDIADFRIHISGGAGEVELSPRLSVRQWVPVQGEDQQDGLGISYADIEGPLSFPGADSFLQTLTVWLVPSFLRVTAAQHAQLPVGIPVYAGALEVELDYTANGKSGSVRTSVPVELVRTAASAEEDVSPLVLEVLCGTPFCEDGLGSIQVEFETGDGPGDVSPEFRTRLDADEWSEWTPEPSAEFTSLAAGLHVITIEARDASRLSTQRTCPFTIDCRSADSEASEESAAVPPEAEPLPQPPSAWIELRPVSPVAGETILLDASESESSGSIETYEWDLDGDGAIDYTSRSPVIEHVFPHCGAKAVRLRVTDDAGMQGSEWRVFEVSSSSTGREVVSVPYAGYFTMSQGEKLYSVRPLTRDLTPRAFYNYTSSYSGTGLEVPDTAVLFLYEAPDQQVYLFVLLDSTTGSGGTASLIASVDWGTIAIEFMDDERDFRDVAQTDGRAASFAWAWDRGTSDGVILGPLLVPSELTLFPQFTSGIEDVLFLNGVSYTPVTIALNLFDPIVLTGTSNGPPEIPGITVTSKAIHPQMTVLFDASSAYDPNDSIVEFAWDYEDDGVVDRITTSPIHTHVFWTEGPTLVALTATDSYGASSSMRFWVFVNPW